MYTAEPRESNIVRVDMLVNGTQAPMLSFLCHHSLAEERGREIALRLKDLIDRQNFQIVIQAAIAGKIVARERIAP